MRNKQIVESFLDRKPSKGKKALNTNGIAIYSYGLKIGEWVKTGTVQNIIIHNYTAPNNFRSQTTSSHVNLLKRMAPFFAHVIEPK